jgi:hypothetical protein
MVNNMFDFPVDFVFTWVDGSDLEWQKKKADASGSTFVEPEANESCRFVSSDELRYAVRSIFKNCSWFNTIYIVTDEQTPPWLNDCEKVVIVDHKTIFGNEGTLPTFNSNTIESCLHKIPNLSEHYIILNDDLFIGRKITKEHFFYNDGTPKIFMSLPRSEKSVMRLITDEMLPKQSQYLCTLNRTRKIVYNTTNYLVLNSPKHTPRPFRKSDITHIEKVFHTTLSEARHHQFRNKNGIYFLALCSFYLIAKGAKVKTIRYKARRRSEEHLPNSDYLKLSLGSNSIANKLEFLLLWLLAPAFFCINDNDKTSNKDRKGMIRFLSLKFFRKSPAEK